MLRHLPTAAFKRSAGILFLLISFVKGSSQTIFPVQASTRVLTPYSVYLADYAVNGNDKLQSVLINRDAAQTTYQVSLRLTVKLNGQVIMRSRPGFAPQPITLAPQVPVIVAGSTLEPYLKSENLDFIGYSQALYEQNRALPEGFYEICFSAYDFFRPDVQVSNDGCGFYYLAKNEPPLINGPACGTTLAAQYTTPIRFSWVPRNNASLNSFNNTKYRLYLYEVNPATMNPNDVVNSTNPVYVDSTPINQTFFDLMPTTVIFRDTFLYAWRVQAVDAGGVDLFRNNGYSEVCTFKWGGAGSSNGAIDSVLNLNAVAEAPKKARVWWTKDPAKFDAYKIYYKKSGNGYNWFTVETTADSIRITDLEPNTEYQVRMQGKKNNSYGLYSGLRYFKTPALVPRQCGSDPLLDSSISPRPITNLSNGAMVTYHEFDININEFEPLSQPGYYKIKKGTVSIPFFAGRLFGLKSESVFINDQNIITQGTILFDSKDLQAWIDDHLDDDFGGNDVGDVVSGDDGADYTVGYGIGGPGAILPVLPITNGVTDLIITRADGGKDTLKNVPLPTTIKDVNGNIFGVDKDGKVTFIGKSGTIPGLDPGTLNKLSLSKARVTFAPTTDQLFAFDAWNPLFAGKFRVEREYEKLVDSSNLSLPPYYVSNKAIGATKQDAVLANVAITDQTIIADSIKFVNGKGTQFAATKTTTPNQYKIQLVGGSGGDAQELYAVYKLNGNWISFGKLKVAGYNLKEEELVLVPMGNVTVNVNQIRDSLNKIYGSLGITWKVKVDAPFFDTTWDINKNKLLDVSGSSFLSRYTSEMKALNKVYKKLRGVEKKPLYMFVFKRSKVEGLETGSFIAGDMPHDSKYGYLFGEGNELIKPIAHEIGHGRYSLVHTFDERYGFSKTEVQDNLMSYSETGTKLFKSQWDCLHDPGQIWGIFEDDNDGQMVIYTVDRLAEFKNSQGYTFLTPGGRPITLPSDASRLTQVRIGEISSFSSSDVTQLDKIPQGCLTNFMLDGKMYNAYCDPQYNNFIYYEATTGENGQKERYIDNLTKALTPAEKTSRLAIIAYPCMNNTQVMGSLSIYLYAMQIPQKEDYWQDINSSSYYGAGGFTSAFDQLAVYFSRTSVNASSPEGNKSIPIAAFNYGNSNRSELIKSDEVADYMTKNVTCALGLNPVILKTANLIYQFPGAYTTLKECLGGTVPAYDPLSSGLGLAAYHNFCVAFYNKLIDVISTSKNIESEILQVSTPSAMESVLAKLCGEAGYRPLKIETRLHILKILSSAKYINGCWILDGKNCIEKQLIYTVSTTPEGEQSRRMYDFLYQNYAITQKLIRDVDDSKNKSFMIGAMCDLYAKAFQKPVFDFGEKVIQAGENKYDKSCFMYEKLQKIGDNSAGQGGNTYRTYFTVETTYDPLNTGTGSYVQDQIVLIKESTIKVSGTNNRIQLPDNGYFAKRFNAFDRIYVEFGEDFTVGNEVIFSKGQFVEMPAMFLYLITDRQANADAIKRLKNLGTVVKMGFVVLGGWQFLAARTLGGYIVASADLIALTSDLYLNDFNGRQRIINNATDKVKAKQILDDFETVTTYWMRFRMAQLTISAGIAIKNYVFRHRQAIKNLRNEINANSSSTASDKEFVNKLDDMAESVEKSSTFLDNLFLNLSQLEIRLGANGSNTLKGWLVKNKDLLKYRHFSGEEAAKRIVTEIDAATTGKTVKNVSLVGDNELLIEMEGLNVKVSKVVGNEYRVFLMTSGSVADRIEKFFLSKLRDKFNSLDVPNKSKFLDDFNGCSDDALKTLDANPDLFEFWKTRRDYYIARKYPGANHKPWELSKQEIIARNEATEIKLLNAVDNAPPSTSQVASAGACSPDLPAEMVVIKYNNKNFDVSKLQPELRQHLAYLDLIYKDAGLGGNLFEKLYRGVDRTKLNFANIPGIHAEVLAVNEVIIQLKAANKFTSIADMSKIRVLVRGNPYGNMCRCPHCFFLTFDAKTVANQ